MRIIKHGDPNKRLALLKESFLQEDIRWFDYYNKYLSRYALDLYDEDMLLGTLTCVPHTMRHNRKDTNAYMILCVATDPKYRRQGVMRELLEHTINTTSGILCIQAYDPKLYLPFGFKETYFQKTINRTQTGHKEQGILPTHANIEQLLQLYRNAMQNYDGYYVRSEEEMQRKCIEAELLENRLYQYKDGYLLCDGNGIVSELMYTDVSTKETLLQMCDASQYQEATNDPTYPCHTFVYGDIQFTSLPYLNDWE